MIKTIHPFPARMAPELALQKLGELPRGCRVLDPMSGSGTVIRQASDMGHDAIGFDLDPLAVLMGTVWTTPISEAVLAKISADIVACASKLTDDEISLPWIDQDNETENFVAYWFGEKQRLALRRLSYALCGPIAQDYDKAAIDALKIAMSRIIITKDQCASLARDTSHIYDMLLEIARVLKAGAEATFVMGNSCLRSVFIHNSEAVAKAAEMAGLVETNRFVRDLPSGSRYLPMTDGGALGKRMRTETILTFKA